MTAILHSYDHEDEDYIDIKLSSHYNLFCNSIASPSHPREFEFQMFSTSSQRETTTSPADELFYRGNLLPLHLPPRLQMFKKLLQNTKADTVHDEFFSTPLTTNTNTTPTSNTPFESCNISPSESCQVSRELNPDEYSKLSNSFIGENHKKNWTRKLKLTNQGSIGSKLKASRVYLKSLFSKSGCSDSDKSRTTPPGKVDEEGSIPKENPFGKIQRERHHMSMRSVNKEKMSENSGGCHRRSFSGAIIKRLSMTKSSSSLLLSGSSSSSSSSSSNCNGLTEMKNLNRSCSATSDIENSIQAAIAHCKSAQQQFYSRKTSNDIGFFSLSASRIVNEDEAKP